MYLEYGESLLVHLQLQHDQSLNISAVSGFQHSSEARNGEPSEHEAGSDRLRPPSSRGQHV